MYIHTSEFKCPRVCMSRYHRNGIFKEYPSLEIFDDYLLGQFNQGLLTMLPQYPLKIVLIVT